MVSDLVLVPRMTEHPDVVTPYDVGPISFESDSKLGILGTLRERFGHCFFLPLPLVFLL